ncbi:MAG TPA: hypothetical protein PKE47_13990 [Verrucomicrobiota bacterium]|nr:hypothetical protein [Verrucomicrobiota bacterium]
MNATLNMTTNWTVSLPPTAVRSARPAVRPARPRTVARPPATLAEEAVRALRGSAREARREGRLLALLGLAAGFALALNFGALGQFSRGFAAFEALWRSAMG